LKLYFGDCDKLG